VGALASKLSDRLSRRVSPWEIALVTGLIVAVIVSLILNERNRIRVEKVETRVNTIETRVVLTPCLQTSDRVCRMFLNRLLAAATPEQLRRLRGVRRLTPREVRREVRRFERERRRAAAERQRRRRGVVPDQKPQGQHGAARAIGAWGRPLDPPHLTGP